MIDIKTLKEHIENKSIDDSLLIMEYGDDDFLSLQYCHAICDIQRERGKTIKVIESIDEYPTSIGGLFFSLEDSYYYVLHVDKFDTNGVSLIGVKNLLVMCKTVSKDIKQLYLSFMTEMPKLEQWQLYDFAYSCSGVNTKNLESLVDLCKDAHRIDNELFKIKLFPEKQQSRIYEQMVEDGCFSDLTNYVIWDLTNAILVRDVDRVKSIVQHIENFDVDSFGLLTILYNNFKNVIKIQLGKNPTAQSVGVSDKQFWAIKKNCNHYTKEELMSIFDCLTKIDGEVKKGEFPVSIMIDYLITSILGVAV